MTDTLETGEPALPAVTPRWRFANVDVDTRSGEIRVDGQLITLERKPREMLLAFLRRPGQLLTKAELLSAIWPGRIVSEAVITNCVAKLRTAIGDLDGQIVRTVHGYGYRLSCAVQIAPEEVELPLSTLEAGRAFLGLPGWQLRDRLCLSDHIEIWRVEGESDAEHRIVEVARSGTGVDLLRREALINRHIREQTDASLPIPQLLSAHLDEAPFFIELQNHRGVGLYQFLAGSGADLDRAARIELAIDIAEAVASLHALGVIHRGLCPRCILVSPHASAGQRILLVELGRGVAPGVERLDVVVLSGDEPAESQLYLAPELLAGSAYSVQADVYALGVIVYQLILGDFSQPLAPGWEEQLGDALLCADIASAAHRNPRQRLGEAGELVRRLRTLEARRLERHEQDQQHLRLTQAERALQLARARRGPLLGLMVALMLGMVISLWFAWHWHRAVIEAGQANQISRAISDFLSKDLLAPANSVPGHAADVTIGTLLDRASETLDQRFADQPLMHASLQRTLGTAYAALIEPKKAIPLLLSAETALTELLGPAAPDTEAARLSLQELLINSPVITAHLDDIEALVLRQIQAEASAGYPHPAVYYPARAVLASVRCWRQAGMIREANCATAIDDLVEEARRKLGPSHAVTLRLLHNRASLMGVAGRVDEAVPLFETSLQGLEKVYGPEDPKLTLLYLQMCKALEYGGNPDRTIPLLQRATRNFTTALGADHPYLWSAGRALGASYVRAGRYAEALALQTRFLDQVTARFGAGSREQLTALRYLVAAQLPAGEWDAAIAHAQSGLALSERLQGDPYDSLQLRDLLATAYEKKGKPQMATALLRQNVDLALSLAPGADQAVARYEIHLARHYLQLGRADDAPALVADALKRLHRLFSEHAPSVQAVLQLQQQVEKARTAIAQRKVS